MLSRREAGYNDKPNELGVFNGLLRSRAGINRATEFNPVVLSVRVHLYSIATAKPLCCRHATQMDIQSDRSCCPVSGIGGGGVLVLASNDAMAGAQ